MSVGATSFKVEREIRISSASAVRVTTSKRELKHLKQGREFSRWLHCWILFDATSIVGAFLCFCAGDDSLVRTLSAPVRNSPAPPTDAVDADDAAHLLSCERQSEVTQVSGLGEGISHSETMDGFGSKLEQKALKQPKQKKSKSAEFLMAQGEEEEEDRRMMKGIVNPAFLSGEEEDEESRGRRRREGGGEIGGDRQDSTLAAHQQQTELEAPANARGNEGARNYFDPSAAVEGDPRRCRMAGVGAGDELELKFMHEDERGLYEKLSQMFNEDDASTIIDLPGSVLEERTVTEASKLPLAGWKDRLREQLVERREEVIPHYVEQLRKRVQDDMIPVGRPSLEQDECAERGIIEEKEWARKRKVMAVLRGNAKESVPIRDVAQEEAVLQDRLYAAFQRAETQLLNSLRQRQAEVIAQYGEITEITANSEPLAIESDLPWQVEWVRAPQPVEVCVLFARAVREKLCRGLYSVSASLHSQLGGPALHWSQLKEQQWNGATEPVGHKGRFCDTDLQLHQSFCMVLPASCDLLPSTVLVFRLLSLPSEQSPVSSVVGWGAFPVCDCSLTLIQGSFRTPLLRGRPHPGLDQFSKIEKLLATDLDNWLCNLYFKVRRLPRGIPVVSECTVTPQIPPGLQPSSSEGTPPDVAASACSSSSLPGKSPVRDLPVPEPSSEKAKPGTHIKVLVLSSKPSVMCSTSQNSVDSVSSATTVSLNTPFPPPSVRLKLNESKSWHRLAFF
ncbi:hypothetical protein AOLI_G00262380 [Acnodon oligacanthus]